MTRILVIGSQRIKEHLGKKLTFLYILLTIKMARYLVMKIVLKLLTFPFLLLVKVKEIIHIIWKKHYYLNN